MIYMAWLECSSYTEAITGSVLWRPLRLLWALGSLSPLLSSFPNDFFCIIMRNVEMLYCCTEMK